MQSPQSIDISTRAPGVNRPVTVTVQHQPTIVRLQPTGAGLDPIGIVVEQNDPAITACRFDPVTVQIQRQRIARRERSDPFANTGTTCPWATRSPCPVAVAAGAVAKSITVVSFPG